MMQNTSFLYHPESVSEMQLIAMLIVWSQLTLDLPESFQLFSEENKKNETRLHAIFVALLIEHVTSYFIELYRRYDIAKNGQLDINGVPRAKTESALATFQYFYICFLIGYILKELVEINRQHVPPNVNLCLQWLVVDCVLMLMTRLYISFALWLKITGEITKNIITLQVCQYTHKRQIQLKEHLRIKLFEMLKEKAYALKTKGKVLFGSADN